jgi:hypothetical protein
MRVILPGTPRKFLREMLMTLCLSDLDGTLLTPSQAITPYTIEAVNAFIANGGNFTYATARSRVTASAITAPLNLQLPSVCYNGAFIFGAQGEVLQSHFLSSGKKNEIRRVLSRHGISPIVYAFVNGVEKFSYITEPDNAGKAFHLGTRPGDPRHRPVTNEDELYAGDAFYITCIGTEANLAPVRDTYAADVDVHNIYHRDLYFDAMWCEILPAKATKAHAAVQLKEMLGCEKLIVFGDGFNDISMFQAADECYATANAVPELKAIATAVIGDNGSDGVARFLHGKI